VTDTETAIHPISLTPVQLHMLFELAAYAVGFRLFLRERRRYPTTAVLSLSLRLALIAGAILGAAIGSRLSWWFEDPGAAFAHFPDAIAMMQGKSILGGLLGGVVGVEIAKWRTQVRESTGDAFVWPIIVALIIGRIGCHLTGLSDHTAGLPTNFSWAQDFGDGIARHPTALYEIVFLVVWAGVIALIATRLVERGDRFRLLLLGYLGFRFFIEYLKPIPHVYALGLSGLQWLCVLGTVYYLRYLPRILRTIFERPSL
jgi:phosphatidylglycerol---prolipoprotein diacylglyceryl transferase